MRATALTVAALLAIGVASSAAAKPTPPFLVCLVTSPGSLGDASLGDAAYVGLHGLKNVAVRVIHSATPATDVESLRSCVGQGAQLTIGAGSLMPAAMDAVATSFPSVRFVIVDHSVATLASRPGNVTGLVFKAQQAGYLVGYAAGLWAKAHGGKAVGSVGGLKIPPVDAYIAGFRFGARRAAPGIKTLNTYAGTFTDAAACRKAALSQIADGSIVEFQVAGRCGVGVLAAARAKHVFAIGADVDQGRLGPWVMTSAVKRVDVAVASTVRSAQAGTLQAGVNDLFGARRGGIGYGLWSARVGTAIRVAVARQYRLLREGVLPGIPSTVQ